MLGEQKRNAGSLGLFFCFVLFVFHDMFQCWGWNHSTAHHWAAGAYLLIHATRQAGHISPSHRAIRTQALPLPTLDRCFPHPVCPDVLPCFPRGAEDGVSAWWLLPFSMGSCSRALCNATSKRGWDIWWHMPPERLLLGSSGKESRWGGSALLARSGTVAASLYKCVITAFSLRPQGPREQYPVSDGSWEQMCQEGYKDRQANSGAFPVCLPHLQRSVAQGLPTAEAMLLCSVALG